MFKRQWGHAAIVVLMLVLINAPTLAMAAGLPGQIVTCDGADCTVCNLATTAQNILNTAIYMLVFLSAVLIAWAGWKMLTSAGNTEGYAQGKSILSNVIIGLVIVLAGWIVVDTLMKTMVNQGGVLGPWNKIC
ncbi:MAG TPA: hypothetical protein VHD38_01770 [Candidatus Paceibacterota bacterium]|nr:hypothetical protein [Candidatus Paceibacterota bacterium]